MTLLLRFWPYLIGAVVLIGAGWYLHHAIYESGYAASEAKWQALYAAAERARDKANEKARQQEADSTALTQRVEAEHEKAVASLNLRAADSQRRITGLVRQLAAHPSGCAVPEAGGPAGSPDATSPGTARIDGAGASISDTGRRCELDAAQVIGLQNYIRGNLSILRADTPSAQP